MTVITRIATCNVGWIFPGGNNAVVTRATSADDLGVINCIDRRPYVGIMAILTDVTGPNMRRILAGRIGTVVAVNAVTGDAHMIEIGGQPADRRVTVVAIITA